MIEAGSGAARAKRRDPRRREDRRRALPDLDTSVPGVLFAIGDHTWDYGALATIRTLGRCGVPTFAMVPTLDLPVVASKYLTEAILIPTTGDEPPDALVDAMRRTCEAVGRPAVAIAGDDERRAPGPPRR